MRGDPRIWKVVWINSYTGKPAESGPLTRAQADQRMRSTQWMPGAKPRIEKVK